MLTRYRISAISIHALLAESDALKLADAMLNAYFYPRSPCGERHKLQDGRNSHNIISIHALLAESDLQERPCGNTTAKFLSTLSLRRATLFRIYSLNASSISIHALLAESDTAFWGFVAEVRHFYPRSPCGERHLKIAQFDNTSVFLSTLSLRRATFAHFLYGRYALYFYPRSPCGERHIRWVLPHGEEIFLSTLSLRRATQAA